MRRNHPRHRDNRPNLQLFDVEYIDLPERCSTHRIVVLPMKTIYYNIAARPDANLDRVFTDVWAFAEFIGGTRYAMMMGL